MLKVEDIKKTYNEKVVLDGVSITFQRGEVYGLVGKNGAGKTTLMNIISKVIEPDMGCVFLDGQEIRTQNDLSKRIAYILDIPANFEYLNAFEYLEFLASPMNLSKEDTITLCARVLAKVGLENVGKKPIKTFSRGMKQRMGLASGLITNPEVVLMDEPSSALDPQGRLEVLSIIKELKKEGKTIILSTHILNDIERVCDRVGLLINGKITIEGDTSDVINNYSNDLICVECSKAVAKSIEKEIESETWFKNAEYQGNALEIKFVEGEKQKVFKKIIALKLDINGIYLKQITIEDIFIKANKEAK